MDLNTNIIEKEKDIDSLEIKKNYKNQQNKKTNKKDVNVTNKNNKNNNKDDIKMKYKKIIKNIEYSSTNSSPALSPALSPSSSPSLSSNKEKSKPPINDLLFQYFLKIDKDASKRGISDYNGSDNEKEDTVFVMGSPVSIKKNKKIQKQEIY